MATKHRGKAAQAAWAAKQGEKLTRARENYKPDAAIREAEADEGWVLEQAAKRKRAPGAGRKPLAASPDDPTQRQDVTMPASLWDRARALGNGNASAGIRIALDAKKMPSSK